MSNLKSIVPPLELCKQIPAGEFEDSALVWCRVRGEDVVCEREHWVGVFGMSPVPAPTLEEILEELDKRDRYENKLKICPVFPGGEWSIGYSYKGLEKDFDLTAAALRLWFKIKGIQCE